MRLKFAGVRTLSVTAVVLICAGCAAGLVDSAATVKSNDDAYFVMGVEPQFTRISILSGKLDGEKFKTDSNLLGGRDAVLMDEPTDGFVLGKTHNGALLDLDMIQPHSSEYALVGPIYIPCDTKRRGEQQVVPKTVVFEAQGGKVLYITTVHVTQVAGGLLRKDYSNDIEGARAFLAKHYPALAGKLEQGSYTLRSPEGCSFD